jgi:hypothetical protein
MAARSAAARFTSVAPAFSSRVFFFFRAGDGNQDVSLSEHPGQRQLGKLFYEVLVIFPLCCSEAEPFGCPALPISE